MIPSVARMEQARAACTEALKTDELAAAIEFLAGRGFSADRCLDLLRTTAEVQVAVADLVELKRSALASSGPVAQPAVLERSLLIQGALRAVDKIQDLPVDESVKKMFFKEFALYASPPVGAEDRFALTSFSFISMCRIICQLRFPGGLLHWERSGFPRSWLKKIPRRFLLRTLRFILFEARGFKPYMV